jgi:hemoglobin/transferrin/lactoferrin receptor protein
LNPGKADTRPLDHIPPLYGKTSFNYHKKKIHTEVYAQYNGWKKLKDYNPSGEDNLQYATAEGTPPWLTLNIKVSAPILKHLSLQAGIENILDRNYRTFGSGLSAPGRNFILALRSSF